MESKLIVVPKKDWPFELPGLVGAYRNDKFFVQEFLVNDRYRLTISLVAVKEFVDGRPIWEDGISFDDLYAIKNLLHPDKWFMEIHPPKDQFVNDANMRHLWEIEAPDCGWRVGGS